MTKKRGQRGARGASAAAAARADDASADGGDLKPAGGQETARRARSISLSSPAAAVGVAMLRKNQQTRVDFMGGNDVFRLGEIYLNELSDLRVFELSNAKARRLRVSLKVELRKPFHTSVCNFQLENENLNAARELAPRGDQPTPIDEFNHVPVSVVRASTRAAMCVENAYLSEGYNELFNHIATVNEITLEPHETKRVIFSMCTKVSSSGGLLQQVPSPNADSSEEERKHLNETSCLVLAGRFIVKARYEENPAHEGNAGRLLTTPPLPLSDVIVPLHGHVCRSLLRLDVKELHFDDCIPGGSFVKDFTVWNRSEIPLLFQLIFSIPGLDDSHDLLTFTDYNSGYKINDKAVQAAAYGHVRIRVTYRPVEVGERFFEVHAQNLHDSRNIKILKIHAVTNKEHHREGLSIKEPNGSYFMSGSKLDFGDCYSGIPTSKTLLIKNATEAPLHVELTSDRPKEVTFELKLMHNRIRASRSTRNDDILSPNDSNDGSSRKGSLSPDAAAKAAATFASFDNLNGYGGDSDDDGDENEGELYDDDVNLTTKRLSFEDNPLGDVDDGDDDFEFDREPRPPPRSPPVSPKARGSTRVSENRRRIRKKIKRGSRAISRIKDSVYESGVDSGSICSSPERKPRGELRRKASSVEDASGSNFLVETLDLPPGIERTILVWYCPMTAEATAAYDEGVDSKACRLSKQMFRVSFRCFQIQGSWQQAQSRVYDRTLGKSIHVRARTCTSIVTVLPSILHMGDCNIGELKSSACVLTNHSELPTVVKPLVTSKVISTVPNDEITLGPKQSLEMKVEIIPRKINPNYSRLISVINLKNRSNIPQVCVRSSNMDAHHVIYHSLFYKLLTPSKSAFLNFDHVATSSVGMQVFDLENITNAPLHLSLQTSDPNRVRLYYFRQHVPEDDNSISAVLGARTVRHPDDQRTGHDKLISHMHISSSSTSLSSQSSSTRMNNTLHLPTSSNQGAARQGGKTIRRRRSFGCEAELVAVPGGSKRAIGTAILKDYLSKKVYIVSAAPSTGWIKGLTSPSDSIKNQKESGDRGVAGTMTPPLVVDGQIPDRHVSHSRHRGSFSSGGTGVADMASMPADSSSTDLQSLLDLFDRSRAECERYCHLSLPNQERESEIVAMIRERVRQFQALLAERRLVPLIGAKDRNVRIPAKSKQRIIAVFTPCYDPTNTESAKLRVEKCKIFITLPPGGNKKAVADGAKMDAGKASWAIAKHPFDSRPSVRELLVKCRVCRSVLNVNQKNINFGRITVSSRSSKKLIVQNMSAIPLVYCVEKTGSISSGFLEIKEGEVGVVKSFGTKEISFEFQPTLAGPFEEKLKIVNVQDPENSLYVTIKARVVKRETFKLLQSGQVLSFGKCLVGEKSELIKIAVRNTSRKRREYAIQLDPTFSNSLIRPTVFFAVDDTPSTTITQAQEKKLDEELEKLEHKLRIAVTKKKTDKITKLNAKISRVRALLSGEQVPDESAADDQPPNISADNLITELYDSNSESEFSEAEVSSRSRPGKRPSSKQSTSDKPTQLLSSATTMTQSSNMLQFTLDPEAVGRVVAYAIFYPVKAASSAPAVVDASPPHENIEPRSQRARKRQLKRDLAPLVGVGKLLLFEQQNKDVVKELQFNAEVFLRTPAGESAYYRAVGKTPLPPVPHPGLSKRPSLRRVSEIDQPSLSLDRSPVAGRITDPTKAPMEDVVGREVSLSEHHEYGTGKVTVKIEQNQVGLIRHSTLLIPVEENPADTLGWALTLTNRDECDQVIIEVRWLPGEPLRGLLAMVATVKIESLVETPRDNGSMVVHGDIQDGFVVEPLPVKVRVLRDHDLTLHLRWMYAPGSGFGSNTPMTSSVSSSILDVLSRNHQAGAGTLDIATVSSVGETGSTSLLVKPVEVALVKAVKRSLHIETTVLDLGQEEQNRELRGQFVVQNRSRQSVKFLLLTPPLSKDASGIGSSVELSFDSSTGKIDPSSQATVRFSFRCSTPGQQSAQILVRNLSDRLETLIVNVTARITRPVYVRIPELDPLATGTLNVLDLGACYVTPEMQDTSVDSPNVSLKFSKTHKLTLLSQVGEDLILSASSNLKTQCYVYEDSRLYREAVHVTLPGKSSLDLYVAVRPRLPLDAFKSGTPRDLVGGIRVQLFRSNGSSENEDKNVGAMVAEFTIKFVGVAGASLSRVHPSLVEFKMEPPSPSLPVLARTGTFEITNVSKALPLQYRVFVSHDTESYSDHDTSLIVNPLQSRGDIPPGESGQITFSVTVTASGLFRRRILVENLHYAGKVKSIDVVVFVENAVLLCDVPETLRLNSSSSDASYSSVSTCAADLGHVPVIRLEEELADMCENAQTLSGSSELEGASAHRKFRIYSESTQLLESREKPLHYSFLLTNTDESVDLIVRPVSTVPLCFQWSGNLDPTSTVAWLQLQPTAFSATLEQLQRLQLNPVLSDQEIGRHCTFFYGGVCSIPAKSSRRLHFRFAPIAASDPLPVDIISSGRPHALRGLIAIQNFASGSECSEGGYARTFRAISLHGLYAESSISVNETSVALGKIGYSLGWRSSSFEVVVRNISEISTYFAVGCVAESIVVTGVRNAVLTPLRGRVGGDHIVSLLHLAATTTRSPLWKVDPFAECVIEMKFVQTPTPMTAGLVEFPVKIHNLLNPHNVEQVLVSAQIVSSYAEITVDPESSGGSIGVGHDAAEIGYLPPVTVPPLADSAGTAQGPSFWFSVKNVFDEELSLMVSPRVADSVKSIAELLICSRSSNTLMSSVTVAPGESIDIRVVCRVKASARISPNVFGDVDRHYNGDLLTFGSVDLNITVQNMKDATQHKEILVRGKVVPGRTFTLSASNLHFYAVATDVPSDMPPDQFPSLLRTKTTNRDQGGTVDTQRNLYQLRTHTETFWIRNPSATQALNFAVDQVPLYSSGLCIITGSTAQDMCAMSEHIQAVPLPSSGSIPPGESVKVTVRLEEVPALNSTDADSADQVSVSASKAASILHKMRHHPSWRSNSWGAEISDSTNEPSAQNHMFLTVRDVDLGSEAALAAEIDVLLVLQPASSASGSETSKLQPTIDRALLGAAFAAREKRLHIPKKPLVPPSLPSPVSDDRGSIGTREQSWGEGSVLDHFEEFDIGSIRSGSTNRQSQLPVLTVRGCTPAEHSTLESTRYVIDVGQHTVRNGGDVEWEITIECALNQQDGGTGDTVDYRLLLVDQSANSWFQLSRDRGTLDSTRSYQSIVMYFYRDIVGVYSTFLILQNVTNPGDLKVIQVKLEVVADLSSLRSMTSGIDPAVNLFRVLVSSQSVSRKLQRSNIEYAPQASSSATSSVSSKLIVDYGEVYYHKLYHNHSIVIENASSMALDFMLSSNAQNEISFSVSPTSFSEVTTVTLPARGRAQVFLHFRPRPDSRPVEPLDMSTEYWSRELEVYVNCRLVKDFRETVVLRAICYPPQLAVDVASSTTDLKGFANAASVPSSITQPSFLGMVFAMTEAAFANSTESVEAPQARYLVVKNTRSDMRARIALRNDSLFFSVSVDTGENTQPDAVEVDYLDDGICAGRRSTLLVSIAPQRAAVFRVVPDLESLRKHRQMWDHSVKEHITLYNIKQFAEHYQVTLCFTSSNVTSYYIPPHIVESYPFSALEDTIAKFLQNYHANWKWLISYHSRHQKLEGDNTRSSSSLSATRLAEVLSELEAALEQSSPLSPRKPTSSDGFDFDAPEDREALRQLLHSYRALYFDFFYITDELIWYGVRSNAVRQSLMLADLAYGVVFNHEIFRAFVTQTSDSTDSLIFPRLLLPWSRQLRHFLSFFPENQEAIRPLRQLYEQLQKFELLA